MTLNEKASDAPAGDAMRTASSSRRTTNSQYRTVGVDADAATLT